MQAPPKGAKPCRQRVLQLRMNFIRTQVSAACDVLFAAQRYEIMNRTLLCTSAVSAALFHAGLAGAQAVDPATQVDEVVVTGEKFERTLQETTTSVAVTTARRIEQESIVSLQDIYNRTANVSETYGSAGFTIRGVSVSGVSGAGDAPLTTVYVDGAPLPSGILFNGPTDVWDMQQVEILRGPQSTLQGLNALAGAVVLRSRDPGPAWDGAALAFRDTAVLAAGAASGRNRWSNMTQWACASAIAASG